MMKIPDGYSWRFPLLAKRAHVFHDGRSLCGRWVFSGHSQDYQGIEDKPGIDDCVECWRKAKAIMEKETKV